MIQNIIDRRKRPCRWREIDAVAEATWHDNAIPDSDHAEHDNREPSLAARRAVSLADAITWASEMPVPMTLYIYDAGSGVVLENDPWSWERPIAN